MNFSFKRFYDLKPLMYVEILCQVNCHCYIGLYMNWLRKQEMPDKLSVFENSIRLTIQLVLTWSNKNSNLLRITVL